MLAPLLLFITASSPIDVGLAERFFQEAKWISDDDGGKLWGKTIYGPLLFVDPATREIVTNQAPPEEGFSKVGAVFTGKLPASIGIANYAFKWKDRQWSMVMWPLPTNRAERATLLMHELFHQVQPALGIPQASPQNAQMETKEGRIWLQVELQALSRALSATTQKERDAETANALLFRNMRYRFFPKAKVDEDALELNEGLAQFTGFMLRGGWEPESRLWLGNQLKSAIGLDTYARRFAYTTGTAYAFLLNVGEANRYDEVRWRKSLTPSTSLADLVGSLVRPDMTLKDDQIIALAKGYGYDDLVISEGVREQERQVRMEKIRKNFIQGPVLVLPLKNMNISFNPSTVLPMREEGTYYPTATLINEWGTLEVTDGVLVGADFKSAFVRAPKSTSELAGPGWKLTLKQGWRLVTGKRGGDFTITN